MKTLLLLRHGLTQANVEQRYCGWTDSPLCPAGEAALAKLKQSGGYPDLAGWAVYTSGLRRTEQTLAALYGALPHTAEPQFRELHFGVFENKTYAELKDRPDYQAWISGDAEDSCCPGGESGRMATDRALAAAAAALRRSDRVAVFTHGGIIAGLMARWFPDAGKGRYDWQPTQGHGYLVQFEADHAADWQAVPKPDWVGKHYSFYQNRECEFFPCHEGVDAAEFNCLFCYCPLYALGEACRGGFTYCENGVKSCSNCTIPHRKDSYGYINGRFQEVACLAARKPDKE